MLTLTHSHFKLLLPGLIGLLAILTLGTDFFSWIQIKQTEQTLQQLQMEKEKLINQKMGALSPQSSVNHSVFLDPPKAGFILAKVLATSHLLLTQMQFAKPLTALKENAFEIGLELRGDYFSFLTFIHQLDELGWNINWQTLHIAKNNLKIKQKIPNKSDRETDPLYPLKIKLTLVIANHYYSLPTSTLSRSKTNLPNVDRGWSPFVLHRYAGKLTVNSVVTDLIVTEDGFPCK